MESHFPEVWLRGSKALGPSVSSGMLVDLSFFIEEQSGRVGWLFCSVSITIVNELIQLMGYFSNMLIGFNPATNIQGRESLKMLSSEHTETFF